MTTAGGPGQRLDARRRARSRFGAGAIIALCVLYLVLVGQRVLALLGSGRGVGVAIGAAALFIPALTVWFLVREVGQARAVDRLTDLLAGEGGLDVDDLPRSPGGRIDRGLAREQFDGARQRVEARPRDWRGWYHLGWAYDAAGDRRRAREALRHAVLLEREEQR